MAQARRKDAPKDHWKHGAPPMLLGEERFRLTAVRGPQGNVTLDDMVTGFSIDDSTSALAGSIALAVDPATLKLNEAHKIRCEIAENGDDNWRRWWTLQVQAPTVQLGDHSRSIELGSTVTRARKGRDSFKFVKDKAHPRGWFAHQIAKAVARQARFGIGKLAKGKHRIKNLTRDDADPVDMIILAYRAERRATGRRFFSYWDGRMNIEPLKRSRYLLLLASVLVDGSMRSSLKENFATVVTVRATGGGKRNKRKIRVRVSNEQGRREFGYVHRTVTAPNADTESEAVAFGRRLLERISNPKREMEVTVPLMPFLRRGHALCLEYPEMDMKQIVFVKSCSHEVSAGSALTTITARFDDPYVDTKAVKDKKARCAKARKRGRKPPPGCPDEKAKSTPKSTKGKRRSDK